MCRLKIIQICRVQSTEALPVSFESKLFFALIKRISLSTGDIKLAKKYIYRDFFKISELELHLIALGSEFQKPSG